MAQIGDWNVANIANWNKIRFPDNSEWKQYRKVKEEVREFKRAKGYNDRLEELADVYIALAGLSRFSAVGDFLCYVFTKMDGFEKLQKAVTNKMNENVKRVFDRNMHHIGRLED